MFSDYELFRKKYFSSKCLDHLSNIAATPKLILSNFNVIVLFKNDLYSSKMGKQFGYYLGGNNTIEISKRVLCLPLNAMLTDSDIKYISNIIISFFPNDRF